MSTNPSQVSPEVTPLFVFRRGPDSVEDYQLFKVELDAGHPILGGHFPGMPVVPGVMQLTLVRRCAEKILSLSLRWTEIDKAKFFTPWTPETGPEASIRLRMKPDETGVLWRIEASIFRDAVNFLSVKGSLGKC